MILIIIIYTCTYIVAGSAGSLAAEGNDRTLHIRWSLPDDVKASDLTSVTFYWCKAMTPSLGACAVSISVTQWMQ